MKILVRKGQHLFYGNGLFPHGLSRSGYFNKRESDELALYGQTFEALQNGTLIPENEEEIQFIAEIKSVDESSLYSTKLWKKYLEVIEKCRIHHGFSMSNGKTKHPSGNEQSFV